MDTSRNIELLDCTLRDGGYVNDWRFGRSAIIGIIERLSEAHIDAIEVGFIDGRRPFDQDRTIQPDTKSFDTILSDVERHDSMLVGMIDYGTCSLENISPCSESVLDCIRLIFKKPKMREAVKFGHELIELGYKVFLQLVSITAYSDRDMLDLIDLVNDVHPYAVSMVDTYGLLQKEELLHYFHIMDRNLEEGIRIGYHSHNNFQLAFANTCELIKLRSRHDILIDATLYGMGKSAGNAPLELVAMYLNENCGKAYDINQILEAIDTNILRIYHQRYWGYNLLFYLSASNDCHPNYIDYLLNKKTLSVKAINEIVKKIPQELKLNYKKECIEQLYVEYQKRTIENERPIDALVDGRNVLLLGPGKTLLSHKGRIEEYIKNNRPVVISVNFIPQSFSLDAVFVSNAKRYGTILAEFKSLRKEVAVIATSNITSVGLEFEYVLDYEKLLGNDHLIEDNALIMLLNALDGCHPVSVSMAGFDGFGSQVNESYYDDTMELSTDYCRLAQVNMAIKGVIPRYKTKLKLSFLTPSLYESDEAPRGYRSVIFDLDGTLLDTSEGILEAVDHIVERYGLLELPEEEKRKFIGPSIQQSLQRHYGLSPEQAWEIGNVWRDVYKDKYLFEASPYEDVFSLLRVCREHGIKLCVATNKRDDYARTLLDHFGFIPLFDCIVGSDMGGKLTKEDLIRICMERTGVTEPERCLMVGDTMEDREAAEWAGVDFLGVTYGFGFSEEREEKFPLANNCKDIENYIIGRNITMNMNEVKNHTEGTSIT